MVQSCMAPHFKALEALYVLRHKEATVNTTRLRELCDAFDAGALREEEMRELVTLAREAARDVEKLQDEVNSPSKYDYSGIK